MINPRISAVWSTTKPIAPFSFTPRVQEVHTKSEVVLKSVIRNFEKVKDLHTTLTVLFSEIESAKYTKTTQDRITVELAALRKAQQTLKKSLDRKFKVVAHMGRGMRARVYSLQHMHVHTCALTNTSTCIHVHSQNTSTNTRTNHKH